MADLVTPTEIADAWRHWYPDASSPSKSVAELVNQRHAERVEPLREALKEPVFHYFADFLPDTDPRAWETLYCIDCHGMVHAMNNETMQAWFDTNLGPVCMDCFTAAYQSGNFDRFDDFT